MSDNRVKSLEDSLYPSLETRVIKVICERLEVAEEEVTSDSSFVDDLGADSLGLLELVMAFEEEFEVEVPEAMVAQIRTVQDAVEHIRSMNPTTK